MGKRIDGGFSTSQDEIPEPFSIIMGDNLRKWPGPGGEAVNGEPPSPPPPARRRRTRDRQDQEDNGDG
jgi:hypothetical protein